MKYSIFDIVNLTDKNKAIIIAVYNNEYQVKIATKTQESFDEKTKIQRILIKANIFEL